MKLHNSNNSVTTNTNATSFTIKTTAKSFKILSDNLYSDKITAVIREYSTNAYDAHVASGKADKPFIVHLPSMNEPYFSVQDFGPGMSDEFINTVFSSYFDSNKADSNEMVGALGLGSKSAFSYTDTFTVESNQGGKYSTFVCFIADNGKPQVSKIGENDTTNEDGITIKFNVKKDDIDEFYRKSMNVFRFFKITPVFTGRNISITVDKNLISFDDWNLTDDKGYEFGHCLAIQGNIAYPIDTKRLNNLSNKHEFVLKNSFRLSFEIGDLDVAASREYLSYDKATSEAIKNKLEKTFNEFYDMVVSKVREEVTPWAASKKFNEIASTYHINDMQDYIPIIYKNEPLKFRFEVDLAAYKDIDVFQYTCSPYSYNGISKRDAKINYGKNVFLPSDNTIFVFLDEVSKIAGFRKVKHMVTSGKTLYFFTKFDQTIIDSLGSPNYILTSSLEKVKTVRTSTSPKQYNLIPSVSSGKSLVSGKLYKYSDLPDVVYYVSMNRNKIEENGSKIHKSVYAKIIENAVNLGIFGKDTMVFGLNNYLMKKYKNDTKFVNFLTYIQEETNKVILVEEENIKKYHQIELSLNKWRESTLNNTLYKNASLITSHGNIKRIFDQVISLKNELEGIKINQTVYNIIREKHMDLNIELIKIDNIVDFYPMLDFVESKIRSVYNYQIGGDLAKLNAYIESVEK